MILLAEFLLNLVGDEISAIPSSLFVDSLVLVPYIFRFSAFEFALDYVFVR